MNFESTYDTEGPELIARFRELLKQRFGAESDLANARNKVQRISILGNPDNEILVYSKEVILAENIAQIKIKSELVLSQYYLGIDEIMQLLTDAELFNELIIKISAKSSRVYQTEERVYESIGLLLKFLK